MLPFSDIDFFIILASFWLLFIAGKFIFPTLLPYKPLLVFTSLFYLVFFYPSTAQILAFVVFCYLAYFFLEYVFKISNKLVGSIILAAPMILVKANAGVDIISFAGMSYITFRVIQVYIDNTNAIKPVGFADFILFLIFPSTLLIGPIDRFERFTNDINAGYANMTGERMMKGWQMFLFGVMHKFVFAELISRYWLGKLDADNKEIGSMLNNMYSYSIFLYFDFAGYSAMAIGSGMMFGVDVPINFNKPFLAINPQDFWRRWHKSLGDWLKDYIFRPMYKWLNGLQGLKQYPLSKQNIALFTTFLVMGMWNGFKDIYILSGSIFGFYSVLHNSYVYYCRKEQKDIFFGRLPAGTVKWLSIIIMVNAACFAIYIFSGRCPY
jgi:membrane protein involved in D-alanine export